MPQHPSPCRYRKMLQLFLTFLGGTVLATGVTVTPPAELHPSDLRFIQTTAPAKGVAAPPVKSARPVKVIKRRVAGIHFYQTTIDLTDPKTFITIGLANNSTKANSAQATNGSEPFKGMVRRHKAAVVASGTFFSVDWQKRIMGNMVAAGKLLKYSPWENYGTTLGIRAGNEVELVTARVDGKPKWDEHWFLMTAGPRLLKQGQVWIAPKSEGFRDPRVLGVAQRSAIGFPQGGKKLVLVTFLSDLSLEAEAKLMKQIGCSEAMNLDGGSSLGLAKGGKVLLHPGRELTNVIVVYDTQHPAPRKLKETWTQFQRGDRPAPTISQSAPVSQPSSVSQSLPVPEVPQSPAPEWASQAANSIENLTENPTVNEAETLPVRS